MINDKFITLDKLLRLGIKNKQAYFVLLSTFCNFAHNMVY